MRMERIPTTPSDAQPTPGKVRKAKSSCAKAGGPAAKKLAAKKARLPGKRSKAETQRLADEGDSEDEDDAV